MSLKTLIAEFEAMQANFQLKGKEALSDEMKDFFNMNPGIKCITWTQYSPYFNDGEACEFRVNSPMFSNSDEADALRHGEYSGDDENIWVFGDDCYDDSTASPTEQEVKAMNEMDKMLQSGAASNLFESLFGNHVSVTITANGISVFDYDHD